MLDFGSRYFPAYCELTPSRFHHELCTELQRILDSPHSERMACAAPRGTAKTTWVALIFMIFCIVHRLKHFPVLITSTAALAEGLIRDVKRELEENDRLAADFPDACGRGPVWRERELVTRNGTRVLALGAGQRIRGRRHHQHRPDLFIVDDLENDEHVRSPEQRDKLWHWLHRAVLKAKGLAKKADVVAIGTLLHFDSVLARLLDARKSPGWRGHTYRSVLQWSPRQDLWDQWTSLYTDWRKPDDQRLAEAEAFFHAHTAEMLAGTEVLWPPAETYVDLMKLRVDEGPSSFDSEKQNQPIDPASCEFQESWFRWFDEVQGCDGETLLVPEKGDSVKLADCDVYGATDPSMGKLDKHRDPSAIVTIAAYPSQRHPSWDGYRLYFVLDAEIRRRHPHEILERILDLHRHRRYQRHVVEAIQFEELFAEQVQEAAQRDRELRDLDIVKVKPLTDKALRIQKLSSLVYSGALQFNRCLTELYNQFRYFPQAAHDDGPDAVALCVDLIQQGRGCGFLDIDGAATTQPKLNPYQQQIARVFPFVYEDPRADGLTCGHCLYRELKRRGSTMHAYCGLRLLFIKDEDIPCDEFDIRDE